MGNWDDSTPTGTGRINQVGSILRELKDAIEEALSHEDSTFPGATPGTTPIYIPGMKRDTTANRPTGDSLVAGRFFANTTLNILERYSGSAWASIATSFPAATKAIFYQSAAPVGWTAVAVNDKFLRVVTAGGTGGTTGGTVAASTSLAHSHTVDSHTHSITAGGSHSHTLPAGATVSSGTSGTIQYVTDTQADHDHTALTGVASGAGTDSKLGAFAYADMVIATKD